MSVGGTIVDAMTKDKKISFKTSPCPGCGKIGTIRRIIWGMPSADIDFSKYAIGGCCIPENPHEIACSECPWSGWRGSLIPHERVFRIPNE
jgi:hypothetical protein